MKPHHGRIEQWRRVALSEVSQEALHKLGEDTGLGYYITCRFIDHPSFGGTHGWVSWVVKHNTETGEIETRNSRYTLVGPELTEEQE